METVPEWLANLVKDAPWIALTIWLLWDKFRSEGRTLNAYKEGSEAAKAQADAIDTLSRRLQEIKTTLELLRQERR